MSWATIAATEVLEEFTPAERAQIANVQNGADNLTSILARVVGMARGHIRAGGYTLGDTDTVPDQLRLDVIAIARWRYLIALPQMKALQTPERKQAHDDAMERLLQAANQKLNVEAPDDATDPAPAAKWNSENKIVPRAHPVPRPGTQQQGDTNKYSNPTGPTDEGLDA